MLYIACTDIAGNEDTTATNENIDYTVDTQYPVQSNWNPAKGSTVASASPTISFDTDENATCRWSLSDWAYNSMLGTCSGGGGGSLGAELETLETTFDADVNALGSASLLWGDQALQATLFYVHSTTKEAQITEGVDFNAPGTTNEIYDESSGWYERALTMFQLSGEHFLGPIELSWRAAAAESTRDAPYERSFPRVPNDEGEPIYRSSRPYRINFSELTDTIVSGGVDASWEFDLGEGRGGTLSTGVDHSNTVRDYDVLRLRFVGGNSLPEDVRAARPDFLFSPSNIDPSRFTLQETLSFNDSYKAGLEILSAYAQADLELIPYVRTTLGVRYEEAEETVYTFNRFGEVNPLPGTGTEPLENDYLLPSVLVTPTTDASDHRTSVASSRPTTAHRCT